MTWRSSVMHSECLKKKRYRTETFAESTARRIQATRGGKLLRVYFCPTCSGYHLTHQPKPEGGAQ